MTTYFLTQDNVRASVVSSQKDTKPFVFSNVSLPYQYPRSFSGNGFFSGTITDSLNAPQAGATVQCWSRTSNVLVATTTTGSDGKYQIVNLPTGEMFDLIAIDPLGKWERKVSSSRYPQTGWYPDMAIRYVGRTLYEIGESVNIKLRAYGGDNSYAYSIDSSTDGLTLNPTTGQITSSTLNTPGETNLFNASAADGSGKTISVPISYKVYSDLYRSYVTSLMHFDAADGTTTFTDDITSVLWTTSNASISISQSKFGGSSGKFTGTSYISTTQSLNFQIESGDFTVECFVYRNSSGVQHYLVSHRPNSTTQSGWEWRINSTNLMQLFFTGGSSIISSSAIPANQWVHCAVVRINNTVSMFIDGVSSGSATFANGATFSGTTFVGQASDGSGGLSGYIDEFRITKGFGRYTSNFTPPTAPFSLT